MNKNTPFEYLLDYCQKYNINAGSDAVACFCLNFWNNNISNNKNAIKFKHWFKELVKEYD